MTDDTQIGDPDAMLLEMTQGFFERLDAQDIGAAVAVVEAFLARDLDDETRAEALALRALAWEQADRPDAEQADLLAARALSRASSYRRYTIEETLGVRAAHRGDREDALHWYRAALATACDDPTTSGAGCVRHLLSLVGGAEHLAAADHTLCEEVLARGFTLLGLPGTFDPTRLAEMADLIWEAGASRMSRDSES